MIIFLPGIIHFHLYFLKFYFSIIRFLYILEIHYIQTNEPVPIFYKRVSS